MIQKYARLVAYDLAWAPAPSAPFLFEGVTLSLERGDATSCAHAALVGDNGCGKTTLARILAGELEPTRGRVDRSGPVGFLQQTPPGAHDTVADALGYGETLRALSRLLAGDGSAADSARVGDRWSLIDEADAALTALGLSGVGLHRSLVSLSGGEQLRARIAALTLSEAQLWILDEPTNHLDRAGRDTLLQLLKAAPPTLLITHDDELLEHTDMVYAMQGGRLQTTRGGLDGYLAAQDTASNAARRAVADAQKDVRRTARLAQSRREKQDQRDAAGRRLRLRGGQPKIVLNALKESAGQSRARTKRLDADRAASAAERLHHAQARVVQTVDLAAIVEGARVPAAKDVVRAQNLCWTPHPDTPNIICGLNIRWRGPHRVAVKGANGAGKSTLIDLIRGRKHPSGGTLRVGVERVAYLDQHLTLRAPSGSVLDNLLAAVPDLPRGQARERLAAFLFWGDEVDQAASLLSGGERLRLALCCALTLGASSAPQLLLLDEPTNHLDRAARKGLLNILRTWPGALVVVSHDDRWLGELDIDEVLTLPAP